MAGQCTFTACDGKDCGDDGCGGTCGTCEATKMCIGGACVSPCCWAGSGLSCPVLDPALAACVCAQDSYCCEVDWDETCAAEVEYLVAASARRLGGVLTSPAFHSGASAPLCGRGRALSRLGGARRDDLFVTNWSASGQLAVRILPCQRCARNVVVAHSTPLRERDGFVAEPAGRWCLWQHGPARLHTMGTARWPP